MTAEKTKRVATPLKILLLLAGLACSYVWAQAIAPPQLGFIQDHAHALRPVYGVAGNFVLGTAIQEKVVSQAFFGSLGLLKTDSLISAFDARGDLLAAIAVPPGPALFAFGLEGTTALAYVPANNSLIAWSDGAFAPLPIDFEAGQDPVVAIAFPRPHEASLFVDRGGIVWRMTLSLDGSGITSQEALIGVRAPLLALPSGALIYSDRGGIIVRRNDSTETHIAASLPPDFSLAPMNHDWVQLADFTGSGRYAIFTATGREHIYRLPGSNPE